MVYSSTASWFHPPPRGQRPLLHCFSFTRRSIVAASTYKLVVCTSLLVSGRVALSLPLMLQRSRRISSRFCRLGWFSFLHSFFEEREILNVANDDTTTVATTAAGLPSLRSPPRSASVLLAYFCACIINDPHFDPIRFLEKAPRWANSISALFAP